MSKTTSSDRGMPKVPSAKPSFSSVKDEPLATAGIGGSEDPKGRVSPGGGEVPADSDEEERTADDDGSGYVQHPDRGSAKKSDSTA